MNARTEISPALPRISILGDIGIDLVMGPLDGWPETGTETLMPRSEMRAGGSAGNAALALRALGAPVRLLSAVGHDALGAWLAGQFDGLETELTVLAAPTSLSVGMIHGAGDRNFFTTHGHLDLQPPAAAPRAARPGDILLLTGVFLLPRLRALYCQLMQQWRDLGYQIAIDTGWPPEGFTAEVVAEVRSWLPLADHILLNDLEIRRLAQTDGLESAMTALSALLRPGATLVAKTGRDGARAWRDGAHAAATPPASDDIFDTIGAGDAFNAGYLQAVSQGADLGTTLTAGSATATRIIAQFPRQHLASQFQGASWPAEV